MRSNEQTQSNVVSITSARARTSQNVSQNSSRDASVVLGDGGDAYELQSGSSGAFRTHTARIGATFRRCLTTRFKHHITVTAAVGSATAAHYILQAFAPDFLALSPLAGFAASLYWIWKD